MDFKFLSRDLAEISIAYYKENSHSPKNKKGSYQYYVSEGNALTTVFEKRLNSKEEQVRISEITHYLFINCRTQRQRDKLEEVALLLLLKNTKNTRTQVRLKTRTH